MTNLSDDVREVLARSTITATTVQLPWQLDRKLYTAVNKALVAAGGKWDRRKGVHVFDSDPRGKLGLAIETGAITSEKQERQAFYTPDDLADRIVSLAELPRQNARILEPSVGGGALVAAAVQAGAKTRDIFGYDIDADVIATLVGNGYANMRVADFLTVTDPSLICAFDAVLMNPPFAKGQALAHLHHALAFPCVEGTLVAVMPASFATLQTKTAREVRRCLDRDYTWRVETVPDGAFKGSGTNVRTVLVVARRN